MKQSQMRALRETANPDIELSVTAEQRNRLLLFEQENDTALPIGAFDQCFPTDFMRRDEVRGWLITESAYVHAARRGFEW